jgi:hypothetical protein
MSIQIFGKKVTGWQALPFDARIGEIPKERKGSGAARKRKGKLRGRLVE